MTSMFGTTLLAAAGVSAGGRRRKRRVRNDAIGLQLAAVHPAHGHAAPEAGGVSAERGHSGLEPPGPRADRRLRGGERPPDADVVRDDPVRVDRSAPFARDKARRGCRVRPCGGVVLRRAGDRSCLRTAGDVAVDGLSEDAAHRRARPRRPRKGRASSSSGPTRARANMRIARRCGCSRTWEKSTSSDDAG